MVKYSYSNEAEIDADIDAGLTNTVTAVKNAQMAESPVLLIGGAAATLLKGRGALQDIDQLVLFRPLCKFCATIRRLRDIKPTITRALHIAQSGTPGIDIITAVVCRRCNTQLHLCVCLLYVSTCGCTLVVFVCVLVVCIHLLYN